MFAVLGTYVWSKCTALYSQIMFMRSADAAAFGQGGASARIKVS